MVVRVTLCDALLRRCAKPLGVISSGDSFCTADCVVMTLRRRAGLLAVVAGVVLAVLGATRLAAARGLAEAKVR